MKNGKITSGGKIIANGVTVLDYNHIDNTIVEPLRIKVTPEGREGIYIPEKESLIAWIKNMGVTRIHHAYAGGRMIVGTDWSTESVLELIQGLKPEDKIGIITRENANMGHSLAIVNEKGLNILDIGKITEKDLDIKSKLLESK